MANLIRHGSHRSLLPTPYSLLPTPYSLCYINFMWWVIKCEQDFLKLVLERAYQ
ncbi:MULTISPECIES: hypothetical protein [unclassified Moorena]|uniref:hypothetical protein n=1 Tax=unclassified Moorena TaxID=2683338 RepID=UPI0013B96555|nr:MULTISPECIES: hypothetical protein [unclassified Moorena]NEP34198.1 hypothetical protein [Moorena sp. SIO3B2]NEQ04538.1 hypothetical protein [Moorena sp. SIO4E2]NES40111.1 hypothetical protein [Moorena sp. SIO2C4]